MSRKDSASSIIFLWPADFSPANTVRKAMRPGARGSQCHKVSQRTRLQDSRRARPGRKEIQCHSRQGFSRMAAGAAQHYGAHCERDESGAAERFNFFRRSRAGPRFRRVSQSRKRVVIFSCGVATGDGLRTPLLLFCACLWPRMRAAVTISSSERLATNPGPHPQGTNQRGSPRPAIRIVRTHTRRHGGVRARAVS